jgi:hypothetical protein
LVLVSFDVKMWRIFDWPRTILPVPVFLKRFAAPLWVFNLGMVVLLEFLSLQHHPVYGRELHSAKPKSLQANLNQPLARPANPPADSQDVSLFWVLARGSGPLCGPIHARANPDI